MKKKSDLLPEIKLNRLILGRKIFSLSNTSLIKKFDDKQKNWVVVRYKMKSSIIGKQFFHHPLNDLIEKINENQKPVCCFTYKSVINKHRKAVKL